MNRVLILIFLMLLIFLISCSCIKTDPVCGANQQTYPNKCVASIAGVDSVSGECTSPSTCKPCQAAKSQGP